MLDFFALSNYQVSGRWVATFRQAVERRVDARAPREVFESQIFKDIRIKPSCNGGEKSPLPLKQIDEPCFPLQTPNKLWHTCQVMTWHDVTRTALCVITHPLTCSPAKKKPFVFMENCDFSNRPYVLSPVSWWHTRTRTHTRAKCAVLHLIPINFPLELLSVQLDSVSRLTPEGGAIASTSCCSVLVR